MVQNSLMKMAEVNHTYSLNYKIADSLKINSANDANQLFVHQLKMAFTAFVMKDCYRLGNRYVAFN